jgi:tripartite-type tricarboxylate transporter receptor subunit TctC
MLKTDVTRRAAIGTLAGLAASLAAAPALAEEWPSRVIRIVSPNAAGGVGDTLFRLIAPSIEARLGQKFIIENRSGANGSIGTGSVVRSPADGYTLLFAPTANYAVNQFLTKNLGFDPVTQLEPIYTVAEAPLLAIVPASVGVTSLKEFAAKAKGKDVKYNYGSPGGGSPTHLAGASFSLGNGDAMQHIAYRGTPPLLQALLGGDVQLAFPTLSPVQEHLKAGKLIALAVLSPQRLAELPNVPTAAEAGFPELVFGNWWVLSAPKGTDPKVIARLAAEIKTTLADPAIRARLVEIGHTPMDLGPKETAAFIKAQAARYKSLIARTGIQLD